ncbi:C40 family peptidase [Liquorilactobacillus sicerae]|uniref:C40 family peptidase n=1 Tax=Liquorilactobacillus sicerae TaxID=1416943 RepID=UPI00248104D6
MKKVSRIVLAATFLLTGIGITTKAAASSTDDAITAVNQKIEATQSSIDQAQKNISKLQSQQTKDEEEIYSLTANINARKKHLEQQARSAQENDAGSIIQFVTNSKNFSDAIDRVAAVVTMVKANNQTLAEQKNDKLKVVADKAKVESAADKQKQLNDQLNEQMANLAVQKVELKVKKAKEDETARQAAQSALKKAQQAAKTVKTSKNQSTVVKALTTADQAVSEANDATSSTTTDSSNSSTTNQEQVANKTTSATSSSASSTANASSVDTSSVVAAAISLTKMNIPYVYGGASLSGMDCSGLTQYVYSKFGVSLPHNAASQAAMTTRESVSAAQPGDLLFWQNSGGVYHVAIYIGGGQFVHAPHSGANVSVGSISGFPPSFAGRLN